MNLFVGVFIDQYYREEFLLSSGQSCSGINLERLDLFLDLMNPRLERRLLDAISKISDVIVSEFEFPPMKGTNVSNWKQIDLDIHLSFISFQFVYTIGSNVHTNKKFRNA